MTNDKLNKFMKEIDKSHKPKHWRKFINENTQTHNIILKYGKKAFCTHCQKYFEKDVLVHTYKKDSCPYCKKEYYVSNCNIRKYSFFKDVAFYSKVNNQIVLRVFEIESTYNYKKRKFEKDIQEYARFIPNVGIMINNATSFFMWNIKIYHNIKINKWHIYTGKRSLPDVPIYPYNANELFKNTVYEYAPIKEFKEKYPYYKENEILEIAGYQSFELLWKMGLYKLSLFAKYFNKKGSFYKRFGLDKKFLNFMVKHNLNYDEYRVLKLLKEENINLIRKYARYDYNYLSFMNKQKNLKETEIVEKFYSYSNELKNICKYVPLRKFLNYEKGVKNIYMYEDYLSMLKKLNYKMKCKDELFPKQLKSRHDKLVKKIKIMEDINSKFGTYFRYLELSKYIYDDGKYIIFPAPSIEDMKDEGEQQGNCVATTYLVPYIKKTTEIYFIRKLNNIKKSLITLEYKENKIRQKELAHHSRKFSDEQEKFMKNWLDFRAFVDKKEKFKEKTIKNDCAKLVA